ncbi:MAG TPA: hypothetical protein VGH43_13420 [Jatrophihabitans sp.]|jgi:hypothetical protein
MSTKRWHRSSHVLHPATPPAVLNPAAFNNCDRLRDTVEAHRR